ncbi:YeiH family protein [Paenibacillus sp. JSM ZJ436]
MIPKISSSSDPKSNIHRLMKLSRLPARRQMLSISAGVLFTAALALCGQLLSWIPALQLLGPLTWGILLAALYRQLLGYPESLRPGIQFTSKNLLRLAIMLCGLKLNMGTLFSEGPGMLLRGAAVVLLGITLTWYAAKWLKAESSLSLLLGIGTGVCGAAAIAAAAPILNAKEEDTALGAGMIAFVGTLFAVVYTLVQPLLPLDSLGYGIWAGLSLHELAQVALASAPAGEEALTAGLMAKLGRVFLLLPLCFVLLAWMRREGGNETAKRPAFPWFLLGFAAFSLAGSLAPSGQPLIPEAVKDFAGAAASFLLAMAMAGFGLQIHLRSLTRAWRPLAAMLLSSVLLSIITFWMV